LQPGACMLDPQVPHSQPGAWNSLALEPQVPHAQPGAWNLLAATAFEVLKKEPTSSPQSADADKERVETLRFVEMRSGPQEPQAHPGACTREWPPHEPQGQFGACMFLLAPEDAAAGRRVKWRVTGKGAPAGMKACALDEQSDSAQAAYTVTRMLTELLRTGASNETVLSDAQIAP
jgi:hypothetical protein